MKLFPNIFIGMVIFKVEFPKGLPLTDVERLPSELFYGMFQNDSTVWKPNVNVKSNLLYTLTVLVLILRLSYYWVASLC